MNISYNWLKEYVDFSLSPDELAKALTAAGLEVEGVEKVESIKGGLDGLVIGEVLTCNKHSNSDHLHVTTVSIGQNDPLRIVCGAPNVAAGQKVVVATVGSILYNGDEEFEIKKAKIRGEESYGMICSETEIGVGENGEGIIVLPDDAQVGMSAKEYYKVEEDNILEIDITPNRADACSHYGVARDIYACLIQQGEKAEIKKPRVDAFKIDNTELDIPVIVENGEACPRYAGITMKGVTVKESPAWLKNKLLFIGLRPINNVVDVTNYILHAFGQPLHCFDADKITGNKVVVKTLPENTAFVTLDGVERKLSAKDLMICNEKDPMCIAGVFGGIDSGATEETTNIFLESAYFHPTWVRKSARRHGLNTDASFRFERGIDPNNVIYCLKLAAIMIKELGGGTISSEIKEVSSKQFDDFKVTLNLHKMNALIGQEIPYENVKSILKSLEIKIDEETNTELKLSVPQYRVDVRRDVDVIEDILRIYGYNQIEVGLTLHSSLTPKSGADMSKKLQNLVSEQLVGSGFNEIMNNSLTRSTYYDSLDAYPANKTVHLLNPLSADLNSMRQTLLFGGLSGIAYNVHRKNSDLRFFEFGNCYYYTGENRKEGEALSPYSEDFHLGLWVTGKKVSNSWAHPDENSSFFELKAYVENIFVRLGLLEGDWKVEASDNDIYATALQYVSKGDKVLATLGVVSKKIAEEFDLENEVYFADIHWNTLLHATRKVKVEFKELPKYPAVRRDLALLVDVSVTFEQIKQMAYNTERKLLKEVSLFDVYEGKNLEPGKKSYAVSFLLQDETKTLNDKIIEKVMNRLISVYQKQLNASLR
ncbi:MAG: phenylalanine--tRNA ligase subunit beta [Bacteroidales bacterium]|nr:phenylalanine--tRNA ligase subunit beta [Bacteroidales bacterium]